MTGLPNIVLVVMDTACWDVVSNDQEAAQEINQLSNQSTTFSTCITSAPWTLPSHASLFTSCTPSRTGTHAGNKQLGTELKTLPKILSNMGYETVAVSNNTWISEEFGFDRGFETFRKNWQYVQSDVDIGEIARREDGIDKYIEVGKRLLDGNPLVNTANAVYGQFFRKRQDDGAKRTNEWISEWLTGRNTDQPFFLFINYLEPHLEYRPSRAYAERFLPDDTSYTEAMEVNQNAWDYIAGNVEMSDHDFEILQALYRAEVAYLDERIGELRCLLEESGDWDDTIFVVMGDHGENIGDYELMDHQYCLYDTLLHVPLIVHGEPFTGGQEIDDPVQLTDIAPTLFDATGIEAPEFREQAQGRSFHPDADTEPREYTFAEYMAPQPSMDALEKRVGDLPEEVYKYDRSLRAIRSTEWKYIRGSDGSEELYHVAEDPGETENLIDTEPEKASELEEELDTWLQSFEHADADGDVSMREETKDRLEDLGYLQ
ncbi:sulfatase [Natrinema salifodinae]|uniref:Arylsulfatase A n=1 Tax=Natrinema salifodinae TaxID=1202768 RepID=A0A1I0M0E0_9EURY|nr:Arylsulfatase A [Natrinema salifodinae]